MNIKINNKSITFLKHNIIIIDAILKKIVFENPLNEIRIRIYHCWNKIQQNDLYK